MAGLDPSRSPDYQASPVVTKGPGWAARWWWSGSGLVKETGVRYSPGHLPGDGNRPRLGHGGVGLA